jgi:hypothetical protein
MKKLIIAGALAAAVTSVSMGSASAAKPSVQACVGTTSSSNAQLEGGNGAIRSSYAKNQVGFEGPGFGGEMQLLQAGGVSDGLAPNTCNNG